MTEKIINEEQEKKQIEEKEMDPDEIIDMLTRCCESYGLS